MSSSRRPSGARGAVLIAGWCAAVISSTVAIGAVGPGHVAAAGPQLRLVHQTIDVASGGPFDVTVELPSPLDPALADAEVVVTSYPRIERRDGVQAVLDGSPGRAVDTVEIPLESVGRPAEGQLQVSVATEATSRADRPDLLQLPRPGLYPIAIEVVGGGRTVAGITTFVQRLADPPASGSAPRPEPLAVSMVMGTSTPMSIDSEADVTVSGEALADLRSLAAALGASAVPVSVTLQPATLAALGEEHPEVATALVSALDGDELLAMPAIGFDPSSAAAAGQQQLFTESLRDGEDRLRDAAPGVLSTRAGRLVDRPISVAGATLVRDLGARLLVLTPDAADALDAAVDDTSLLHSVPLAAGTTIDAAIVDPRLSRSLAQPGADLQLASVRIVAELLAMRAEIDARGDDPIGRHSVVLGAPDGGPIGADLVGALTTTMAGVAELAATPVSAIAVSTEVAPVDTLRLPDRAGVDIGPRMDRIAELQQLAASTATMLPDADLRPVGWRYVLAALPSTDVGDDQFDVLHDLVEQDVDAIRASVDPPEPFSFTLTGRSSTIRLNLTNTSTTPLEVLLRFDRSLKLRFPEGQDVTRTLEPGVVNTVQIPVETRSKGRFPVTMTILTPDAGSQLSPPVLLTANVNALTGLGPLVTGGAVLILASWWAHHWRCTRRRRLAAVAATRHPVAASNGGDE